MTVQGIAPGRGPGLPSGAPRAYNGFDGPRNRARTRRARPLGPRVSRVPTREQSAEGPVRGRADPPRRTAHARLVTRLTRQWAALQPARRSGRATPASARAGPPAQPRQQAADSLKRRMRLLREPPHTKGDRFVRGGAGRSSAGGGGRRPCRLGRYRGLPWVVIGRFPGGGSGSDTETAGTRSGHQSALVGGRPRACQPREPRRGPRGDGRGNETLSVETTGTTTGTTRRSAP